MWLYTRFHRSIKICATVQVLVLTLIEWLAVEGYFMLLRFFLTEFVYTLFRYVSFFNQLCPTPLAKIISLIVLIRQVKSGQYCVKINLYFIVNIRRFKTIIHIRNMLRKMTVTVLEIRWKLIWWFREEYNTHIRGECQHGKNNNSGI